MLTSEYTSAQQRKELVYAGQHRLESTQSQPVRPPMKWNGHIDVLLECWVQEKTNRMYCSVLSPRSQYEWTDWAFAGEDLA